jgi:hypothetical protein
LAGNPKIGASSPLGSKTRTHGRHLFWGQRTTETGLVVRTQSVHFRQVISSTMTETLHNLSSTWTNPLRSSYERSLSPKPSTRRTTSISEKNDAQNEVRQGFKFQIFLENGRCKMVQGSTTFLPAQTSTKNTFFGFRRPAFAPFTHLRPLRAYSNPGFHFLARKRVR